MARDLHDGLTQMIVAADMHLEAFRGYRGRAGDEAPAGQELERASQLMKKSIAEARHIISQLRPSTLDDFGLAETVRMYLQDLADKEGWEWEFEADLQDWRPDPLTEAALFRIIQEALNNVRKYAAAARVRVGLRLEGDVVQAEVRDWGRGYDVDRALAKAATGASLGLIGMLERAQLLSGRCELTSEPGQGAAVRVILPAEAPQTTSDKSGESDGSH
ncbi:MAG: sensor histidine kinase [Chloroflexi bacterium]|nr:sensor histidine kinase [Chloroflexota bacterium]